MTITFYQHYWWILVSLLGAALVVLLFVQGGQSFIYSLGKDHKDRTVLLTLFGRKWELTFTTLVVFGGAFFASFPLFYSTSFGGAYWVWICILFSFIIQAVSYEYRSKPNNVLGQKTFDLFLFINGTFSPFLLGVAVATFFTGSAFHLNDMNNVTWDSSLRGLEALANWRNLLLGFSVAFLARILALLYLVNNTTPDEKSQAIRKKVFFNSILFLVAFLPFLLNLVFFQSGFRFNGSIIVEEKTIYLNNLIDMWYIAVLLLSGIVLVLIGIIITWIDYSRIGFWFTAPGVLLTVFSLLLLAGFKNTCYYPSISDVQSSLHLINSSSSLYTLKIMSIVSLFIPIVIAYIYFAWRSINKINISKDEMNSAEHKY